MFIYSDESDGDSCNEIVLPLIQLEDKTLLYQFRKCNRFQKKKKKVIDNGDPEYFFKFYYYYYYF
jgi:hypothetical protein